MSVSSRGFLHRVYGVLSIYSPHLSDDNEPQKSLAKLKAASKALKSAQRASRETAKEVNRAKRAVAEARKNLEPFENPRIRSRRKQR